MYIQITNKIFHFDIEICDTKTTLPARILIALISFDGICCLERILFDFQYGSLPIIKHSDLLLIYFWKTLYQQ